MRTIRNWQIYAVDSYYSRSIRWANSVEDSAPLLILRLEADDGAIGISEITVKSTWYGISYSSVLGALKDIFFPRLSSLDVTDPSAFYKAASSVPENQAAKALIDNALWDMTAFSERRPLWQKWGGDDSASVSWIVSRQSRPEMVADAVDAVERLGIKTLKIKGGQGFERDIDIIGDIRGSVGTDVRLYVDPNWHYDIAECPDYIHAISEYDVSCVEDPCPLCPDKAFEDLQRTARMPIIIDNFVSSTGDARAFADRGMRALSLKPARIGITECLRQRDIASAHSIQTHVGFGGEGHIGTWCSLQLAASLPCRETWLPAESSFFTVMTESLVERDMGVTDGSIDLSDFVSLSDVVNFSDIKKVSHIYMQDSI